MTKSTRVEIQIDIPKLTDILEDYLRNRGIMSGKDNISTLGHMKDKHSNELAGIIVVYNEAKEEI